jgi:hypothetical protein
VFTWFLFGLEPGWEKVSQKKLNENMFSGRQTLRRTLEFGVRHVCRVQLKKSTAKRPIDAATVTVAASVAKSSSRLSTVEKFCLGATDADQRPMVDQRTRLSGFFWRNRALCGASVVPVLRPTPTVITSVVWIRSGFDPKKSVRSIEPPPHLSDGFCSSCILNATA